MKAVLLALNASFVHTNLAVRLLEKSCKEDVEILELTINENKEYILKKILDKNPDYIFWSAYIWNWSYICELGDTISKMGLEIRQFVGGPEVSYDMEEHLKENPWIEGILVGEGEEIFSELISCLHQKREWKNVQGLAYWKDKEICINPTKPLSKDLDHLPSLDYREEDVRHRIIYYEAMRGCPYNCAYCLSSLEDKVRYRSMDKIKEDLKKIFKTGTKQIKFVDRSFSIHKDRAIELIEFMKKEEPGDINIHLEMNLEDLNQDLIDSLTSARVGLFQIEAGVQSTNSQVLNGINRKTDIQAIKNSMDKLSSSQIHRHLDLIVGLPGEDTRSFLNGFDDVYEMKPERIQIGFLKLLRGTTLRNNSKELGISYENKAPYTIIKNKSLSAKEVLSLHSFEKIIENYCDEHKFINLNHYITKIKKFKPSSYFYELANYYEENMDAYQLKSQRDKYRLLYSFFQEKEYTELNSKEIYDYLKMDFYLQEDQFIEKVLEVEDKEYPKGYIIDWLRELDPNVYIEFGSDIHRVSRMCRAISLRSLGFERLLFYKNHKHVMHLDRRK